MNTVTRAARACLWVAMAPKIIVPQLPLNICTRTGKWQKWTNLIATRKAIAVKTRSGQDTQTLENGKGWQLGDAP